MVSKKKLEEYQIAYSQGQPLISDSEYDGLLEEYLVANGEKNRPFLRNKQSTAINDIVGTLPKVYGVTKPFRANQKCYADWCKDQKFSIFLQPKFDGCSIALDVNTRQFFTRGNFDDGESIDVTVLFEDTFDDAYYKHLMDIGITSVKYEAMMSHETFKHLKLSNKDGKAYVDPRSVVSGIITSRNKELSRYINLIALRRISNGEFLMAIPRNDKGDDIFTITDSNNYDHIQEYIDLILGKGATVTMRSVNHDSLLTFSVDGVVVSKNYDGSVSEMDRIDPAEEVAIKILNDVKETTIYDIDYQFGLSGRITPVAKVKPIDFEGRTIKSIGLSTLDRVASLALRYGDTVSVTYNIVPYLLGSKHDGDLPIPIPTKCPHCGDDFDMTTLRQIKCINRDCPGMKLGSIVRYCKKMSMFGLDMGIISKLKQGGAIDSIESLYRLTVERICAIQGFKEKSAQNIVNTIAKQSKNVELHKWLGSWPMEGVSSKIWASFIKQYDQYNGDLCTFFDDLQELFIGDINDLKNRHLMRFIGDELDSNHYHGIHHITMFKMLCGLGNNIKEMSMVFPYIHFIQTKKSKGKVCLSGTRDKDLKQTLETNGWEVVDALTKDCKVILSMDDKSKKYKKAVKLQIPTVIIEDPKLFKIDMLNNS